LSKTDSAFAVFIMTPSLPQITIQGRSTISMRTMRCLRFLLLVVLLPSGIALSQAAPIPVTAVHRDPDGVTLAMQPGTLRLQVCTDRIVRVSYSPTGAIPKLENFVVIAKWNPVPFRLHDDAQAVMLATAKMQVRVDKADGAVHFLDAASHVVLEEPAGGAKATPPVTVNHESAYAPEQGFLSPPDESIWGLGQHPQGTWNWRGMPYQLRQVDTDIALPMIVSSRGYGLLWDNASLTDYDPLDHDVPLDPQTRMANFTTGAAGDYVFMARDGDARNDIGIKLNGQFLVDIQNPFVPYTVSAQATLPANTTVQVQISGGGPNVKLQAAPKSDRTVFRSQVGDAIDYTFFYGPKLDDVIAGYREATGAATMWPKWAFGFWQCREHYDSQQHLLEAAQGFRDRHIPVDLIIQDWHYWPEGLWGAYQWDPARYPDPAGMIRTLHDEHLHFMISTWSNPHGEAGDALAAAHLLIDNGNNFVEVTNPAARAMRWFYVNKAFFSIGTDGWWQDCTEPNDFSDVMEDRQFYSGSSNRVRNAYPLFASQSTYEGQRAADPSKRVVILTRSAWPGLQRYGSGCWSADIEGTWESYRRQVTNGLNFCLSGIPYWTTDTGGFFRPYVDQVNNPDYNELLQRWFAWSTFCPILRVHGNQTETEMWKWPLADKNLEAFDALRYRFLPYNYSVAWMTTHRGYTPMRGLPFDFPGDPKAAAVDDQFMSGPAIMVSPVTKAFGNAHPNRPVYLPAGTRWTDFWTGQGYDGGQTITADAPLDQIPLHVRAGSILPLGPALQYADEKAADPLELRVYRGANGSFTLYEDEGDSYRYEQGVYATIPMRWNDTAHTLTIGKREGGFPGMLASRIFRIVLVSPGRGIGAGPAASIDGEVHYAGNEISVPVP
jgi:alpha-D-xyloside xylohydrolase